MKRDVRGCNDPEKKIVALGELLIDMIPARENMLISDPGPVIKTVSGSAGIFACAAQLLGECGGFIGQLGKDSLSGLALRTMEAQGVDISHLKVVEEGQIGLAFLEYTPERRNYQYYRTRSVGSLFGPEQIDEACIANAYMVHYPGMLLELTEEMRGACERMVEVARKFGVPVSFDPNIRKELGNDPEARKRLLRAIETADVIAPTFAEAKLLTGEETMGAILRKLHAMGPTVVAVTCDKDGAVFSRDGQVAIAAGIDRVAVDPTGAGDTLAAALCVALKEEMPLEKLAAFCNSAGTLAVEKRGAIGVALPTRAQAEALAASSECRVTLVSLAELE